MGKKNQWGKKHTQSGKAENPIHMQTIKFNDPSYDNENTLKKPIFVRLQSKAGLDPKVH